MTEELLERVVPVAEENGVRMALHPDDPPLPEPMGGDVYQAIRDIGAMNKIIYVHFRNVRGTPVHFDEVFIDEGDVDMFEAMRAYKEIGFEGPFMRDHMPAIPND